MKTAREGSVPTAIVCGVGAEKGLGATLCRRFGAEGYHVLVAGRTPDKIEQVAASIIGAGGSAEIVQTDVTEEADVVRLFDRAMVPGEGRSPADLVVYNAGNNRRIEFRELSARDFETFWRVGCFGGFLVGREAVRRLVPLGRGTVIFTGASASLRGRPGFAQFAAAKAGLRATAQSMAREFGPLGSSCRACHHRRRHRRRAPLEPRAATRRRARRRRFARDRCDRRNLLANPSPATLGLDP